MGNRLSKIYTRTGDDGTTGLGDGSRVHKTSARVEAYGCVDELNSLLGLLAAGDLPAGAARLVAGIQQQLFDLGGELCVPGSSIITSDNVTGLEQELDRLNAALPPLKDFILPGGNQASATCHLARAVCRRAERRVLALAATEEVSNAAIRYLNRLSDLLFVLARVLNRMADGEEVLWTGGRLARDSDR